MHIPNLSATSALEDIYALRLYRATAISLRAAIRLGETGHACNRDVSNWRNSESDTLKPPC